jgi:hypothetical protein
MRAKPDHNAPASAKAAWCHDYSQSSEVPVQGRKESNGMAAAYALIASRELEGKAK